MTAPESTSAQPSARMEATARRVEHSRPVTYLARSGYVGWGVVHLLVAYLALRIAFGQRPQEGDQSGAFRTVASTAPGKVLLVVLAVALVGLAVWQALVAAVGGPTDQGFDRVLAGGRAVIYAVLAWTAFVFVAGSGRSNVAQQQTLTAKTMAQPGGRWLVGAVGLAILIGSLVLAWFGLTGRYRKKLWSTPRSIKIAATVGYPAKGVAYGIVGLLVLMAAVTFDPHKSSGLDGALRTIAAQPFGRVLLVAVGVGIAAYGIFCFAQAKYRRI